MDGVYLFCNPALAQLTGHAVEQIVGHVDADIAPIERAERYRQQDLTALASDQALRIHESIVDASGHRREHETYKIRLNDAAGRAVGVLGFARDVTAQRAADRQMRRVNRLYKVLTEVNSLIAARPPRERLFEQVCRGRGRRRRPAAGLDRRARPGLARVAAGGRGRRRGGLRLRMPPVDRRRAPRPRAGRARLPRWPAPGGARFRRPPHPGTLARPGRTLRPGGVEQLPDQGRRPDARGADGLLAPGRFLRRRAGGPARPTGRAARAGLGRHRGRGHARASHAGLARERGPLRGDVRDQPGGHGPGPDGRRALSARQPCLVRDAGLPAPSRCWAATAWSSACGATTWRASRRADSCASRGTWRASRPRSGAATARRGNDLLGRESEHRRRGLPGGELRRRDRATCTNRLLARQAQGWSRRCRAAPPS